MAGQRRARVEHRQHVEQAEHLHFDGFVAHGPSHDAIVPPAPLEDAGTLIAQMIEEVATDLFGRRFDPSQVIVS